MAFVPEVANWEEGIYQFEETDVLQGGPNGIDNLPSKQIANRLLWLKALAESLGNEKLNLSALASQAEAVAGTDNAKWMSPLRVAQAIAALATTVAATETVAGKVELATNAETVTGTDTARATHPAGVKAAINAAIANLVNAAPGTLDTLNELAVALGNDPNFAATMAAQLASKQPADATLTALASLATGANKLIYSTGADSFALTDLSVFARTLIDDPDAATARQTLGAAAATDAVPAGTVIFVASASAPTGYLKANGASLSRVTYSALFAVIGTTFGAADAASFNLPDLRGEFIRGFDDSRGVDAGRALGTYQADSLKSHTHGIGAAQTSGSNLANNERTIYPDNIANSTLFSQATGGSETRPRNISLLACIKF